MSQTFAAIPVRLNGDDVDAGWFNILRQAGVDIQGGYTSFLISNNQASPIAITGLIFDPTLYRSFELDFDIYRNTTGAGATELGERTKMMGVFSTVVNSWQYTFLGANSGGSGVTLSIDATGQIYYTSTNITGTAATSKMNYTSTTMGV